MKTAEGWQQICDPIDSKGKTRSIEDIEVQLRTADGQQVVAAVRSSNMGFYLLPLKDAPWDVYYVGTSSEYDLGVIPRR